MATIEANGILELKDANGNLYLVYPVTKKENIADLEDATTSESGLMSVLDKIKLDGITDGAVPRYYAVCSTAAATAEKAVTVDDTFELVAGAQVTVKFTNANSVASPTLNVNGTGAKPIYRYGTTVVSTGTTTTGWVAGAVQTFTYDGTGWIRDYWSNTTYSNVALGQGYATCATAAATTAKVGTLSSYALTTGGIVAVKFTYDVPAGATLNINSKGAKGIYHRGAAITAGVINAGDIATFMYNGSQYILLAVDAMQATIESLETRIANLEDKLSYYVESDEQGFYIVKE